MDDFQVLSLVKDFKKRERNSVPVVWMWDVSETKSGRIWCDASSVASRILVEINGVGVEDQS